MQIYANFYPLFPASHKKLAHLMRKLARLMRKTWKNLRVWFENLRIWCEYFDGFLSPPVRLSRHNKNFNLLLNHL